MRQIEAVVACGLFAAGVGFLVVPALFAPPISATMQARFAHLEFADAAISIAAIQLVTAPMMWCVFLNSRIRHLEKLLGERSGHLMEKRSSDIRQSLP
jgi:hypothetical protein